MAFTADQRTELGKPLDPKHVKPPAPGKYGEYIQGWHVIDEANRIFGFDGWSRETVEMNELCRAEKDGKWYVSFVAKVRVSAGGIAREGTGCGSGDGMKNLGDAIESAIKEAETDAMKRALMTFGNQFGLALYDKTKANVQAPSAPPYEIELKLEEVTACETQIALQRWWKDNNEQIPNVHYDRLLEAVNKRRDDIDTMDRSRAA